ncbi:MAG: hypothetical protein IID41_03585 [Planctomycetes bacterium]|nr:hypothetical protein [Planctomycetota bacterium]
MNKLWKLVIICTSCLCFAAADSARADYVGLVHVTKADDDTVNLCNNGNGDLVPEPLDVCNVLAEFDNPVDRLLSVGNADVSTSDPSGYFQHTFGNPFTAPACNLLGVFPDLICDSFITIGWKCNGSPDFTTPDPDFNCDPAIPNLPPPDDACGDNPLQLDWFNEFGHVFGGWFSSNPDGGQGDAGQDPPNQNLQVLLLQLSVPTGASITGTISVFAKIGDDVIEFDNQVVDCFAAGGCEPADCDDGDACTDDACIDKVCVNTPVDCADAGNECNTASCDANGADGNCDILMPVPDGTSCGSGDSSECDDADSCLGGVCQDNYAPAGDPCGDQGVECLENDTCDGAGGCDDNGNQPNGTSCGSDSDTECDDADSCLEGACQDNNAPAGDPCGDQGAECLVDDTCDGAGECMDNGNEDDGTPCGDGDECLDGVCEPVEPCPEGEACDDGNDCTEGSTCDAGGNCVGGMPVKNGTPCGSGDSSECDDADSCLGGVCQDNNAPAGDPCGDQGVECLENDTCDGAGGCNDNGNQPDGTGCNDGDDCTDGDVCSGGSCSGEPFCEPGEVCVDGECVELGELELPLDIKPRMCPNTVMRDSNAAVWAALLGSEDFDITQVRMSGLLLSRADGVGSSLAPKNLKFKDEGTPFEGELCDCHAAGRDQITDLRMKFKTDAMVEAFHLNDEPSGSTVELIVTGQLNDGTMIFGRDCILLVR